MRANANERPSSGTLFGVGLGPGDPELVTVKAARVIGEADVVAYHSARHGRSIARRIAEPYLRPGQIEEHLVYPVTTETTDHPGGYAGAMEDFYREAAERIAAHLDAGRDVALLAEGDPLFYSSYMHMHTRLTERFDAVIIPGVTSVSAASAATATPLVTGDEVLSILPGTMPVRRAGPPPGRHRRRGGDEARPHVSASARSAFAVRTARRGVLRRAGQHRRPAGAARRRGRRRRGAVLLAGDPARAAGSARRRAPARVAVVGLGPGDADWMTPQSRRELAAATDLIGYGPYLDRVPSRRRPAAATLATTPTSPRAPGWPANWPSRAARWRWCPPAIPGVFAMATAVLEEAKQWPDVAVRVIPAMTAAQAVASRVGAPLGHDYAVISLSDRLKPWEVIAARLSAAAAADLVLAIYNPASKSRTWQVARDAGSAARAPRCRHPGGDRPRRVRARRDR